MRLRWPYYTDLTLLTRLYYTRWGTPFLLQLGLSEQATSLVWLAGPISGLIAQPLIGAFAFSCVIVIVILNFDLSSTHFTSHSLTRISHCDIDQALSPMRRRRGTGGAHG